MIALPALLAVFMALSFFAQGYLPDEYKQPGEAISVGAFKGGYDAIIEELAKKQSGEAEPEAEKPQFLFSLDNSEGVCFFDTKQTLDIKTDKPAQIYYTTDGTAPDYETGTLYTGPLTLECGANVKVYNFSVIAYYDDGGVSKTAYRSYFVGSNAAEKYDTLVLSLTSDPKNLTSRKTGIFNNNNIWQHGRKWERELNVDCYSPDGQLLFTQNAGIRIYGAYSRSMSLKSMRLIARKDYDVKNRFDNELFDNLYASDGTKIKSFQQLILRNAGNDFGDSFMRDETVHMMMAKQGAVFTETVRPCMVYVNGELYGFYWIHEPYKDSYFENRFGNYGYNGSFVVLDGPERTKSGFVAKYKYLNPISDYKKMYAYSKCDLTDDALYAELCQLLDVDSFLQLYAAMAYVDNGDWPQNNHRVFKYFPVEGEDFSDVYGMDGKWYFLPHDTDWAFFGDPSANTLNRNYNKKEIQYSPMFVALMQRWDCQRTFVTYMLDMMNGEFSSERGAATARSVIDSIKNSINIMHNESKYAPPDSGSAAFKRRSQRIVDYLKQRGKFMTKYLKSKYDLGEFYKLSLDFEGGGAAYVNTLYVDESFTGTYYENYSTILKPIIPPGKIFGGWMVNGELHTSEELEIDNRLVKQARVEIALKLADPETPALSIYEVSSRGKNDYIVLVNNTNQTISTLGYTLTDNGETPTKYIMPVMRIAPGEKIKIYCKTPNGLKVLRSLVTNFALKKGETLTLSKKDPSTKKITTLESVKIPKIDFGNVYCRNMTTGLYFECPADSEGMDGLAVNRFDR